MRGERKDTGFRRVPCSTCPASTVVRTRGACEAAVCTRCHRAKMMARRAELRALAWDAKVARGAWA
jgi:hypothetical protein